MKRKPILIIAGCLAVFAGYLALPRGGIPDVENFPKLQSTEIEPTGPQLATFGGGCFWCTEAVFQQLNGVTGVVSGYSGGASANPTYKQICSGTTGHAEVIQVSYDPQIISYSALLEVFWRTHDATTLNRQGNDVGTQYRSVIFTHNEFQKKQAEAYKSLINEANVFGKPIVTEIVSAPEFYRAEDYHQKYLMSRGQENCHLPDYSDGD